MAENPPDVEDSSDIGARDAADAMDTSWDGRLRERDPNVSYTSDTASDGSPSPQRKLDAFGFIRTQSGLAHKDSSARHHANASKAASTPAMAVSKTSRRPTPNPQDSRVKTEPAPALTPADASAQPTVVVATSTSAPSLARTTSAARLLANLDSAVRPAPARRAPVRPALVRLASESAPYPIPHLDEPRRRPTLGQIDGVASRSQHDLRIPIHELDHRSLYIPRTREQRIEAKEAREWMLCLMASLEPNFPVVDLELGTAQLYKVSEDQSYSRGSWVPYEAGTTFRPQTIERFLKCTYNGALHRKLNAVGVHTPEDLLTIASVVLPDSSALVQFRLGLELELRSQWRRLKSALKAFARAAGPDIY
ncbi:hypothetical protein CYLTODRAFT_459390 [Cylindrobasidium torrendii FP15055 ss-10]|uniref:Uncharacterized protein n=1 Tax=Cylindrobasidium torrendii FP15055 ss-10 TaxID=1314674 RepID=A0A0D7AUT9_9AGAR|nr:hypothetical protein CYLTODRAFT_459390 [Cylindrobasidium torrendii FP15055 ss-10]